MTPNSELPSNSVIVVTLNRPDCVEECLGRLATQEPQPDQVIVVDASADDLTERVVAGHPEVEYYRHEGGAGKMTASRNIALLHASGDVLIFLDDDAFAHPGWLAGMLDAFDDGIGAVGGRVLPTDDVVYEEDPSSIGKITDDGHVLGNFTVAAEARQDVDHVMGCNMAFSRSALATLGGFREDYVGVSGVREDTDVCLRVGALGLRLVYAPDAVVTHIGAPQAIGRRFDLRYTYYASRNHVLLLARNYGLRSSVLWKFVRWAVRDTVRLAGERMRERKPAAAGARSAATLTGLVAGLATSGRYARKGGTDPVRRDAAGREMAARLTNGAGAGRTST